MRLFFTMIFLILSIIWTIISVHVTMISIHEISRSKNKQEICDYLKLFFVFFAVEIILFPILIVVNTLSLKLVLIICMACLTLHFMFLFFINLSEGNGYCFKPFLLSLIILLIIIRFA